MLQPVGRSRVSPGSRSWGLSLSRVSQLSRPVSFDLTLGLVIGVATLILSLAHPWSHAWVGEAQNGDAAYWDFAAENWARGYIASKSPDIRPGYSLFMGIIYVLFGVDVSRALTAQSILYAIGAVMLYVMGSRLGGRLTGVLAAAQYAINPYLWEWTVITTTDLVGCIANLTGLFFLIDALRGRGRLLSAAAFGVFFAIANIIRIFTLPVLGPALLLFLMVRTSWRRRAALIVVTLAATFLGLLPGVLYQYISTGDLGLSSNSASAIFAASSPKYRVWDPKMYEEVSADLAARGEPVTPQSLDAEFRRLTLQNYLDYPLFQFTRIGSGFYDYAAFEGETERPDRYVFYRPYILAALIAGIGLLSLLGFSNARRWLAPLAAIAAFGLYWAPRPTLLAGLVLGVIIPLALVIRRRGHRELGWLAVALFFSATGLFAVLSAGISGFLLHRLNLQVEPARALLLALAVSFGVAFVVPNRLAWSRLLQLHFLVRSMPRLPVLIRSGVNALAMATVLLFLIGGLKLTSVNLFPPAESGAFVAPSPAQLAELSKMLGLREPPRYLDAEAFVRSRADLSPAKMPTEPLAFAVPSQLTRFIWYMEDQERTLYWFVYTDQIRPTTLDRNLLLGEAYTRLPLAEFRDRLGLLIIEPTNAYFANTGDWAQLDLIPARAFVPWDSTTGRFQLDAVTVFPQSTSLLNPQRIESANKVGEIRHIGTIRVSPDARQLPTLSLKLPPSGSTEDRQSVITYRDLWIPPRSYLQTWLSIHPTLFANGAIGQPRVEVHVRTQGQDQVVGERLLDPMSADDRLFLPCRVDLSTYENQHVELTIRVRGDTAATVPAEVLFADPRIVSP